MPDRPTMDAAPERAVLLSDTTLRDGEQMPGVLLGAQDKADIARALEWLGIRSIDAGFAACGRVEIEAIQRVADAVDEPVVSSLSRTVPRDIDAAWEALKARDPRRIAVSLFLATSPVHREKKLHRSTEDLLRLITEMVQYARGHFDIVVFSAEDASRTEPAFLDEVYDAAIRAGAGAVGFPDTVGIMMPDEVYAAVSRLRRQLPPEVPLAVHMHDDLGLATANTLAGVAAGANMAQCTVNGIGERAGNACLEEVALALAVRGIARTTAQLDRLPQVSRLVAERTGVSVSPNKSAVGDNIFRTEAGIHQDGILKAPETYLPFPPQLLGAERVELTLGKHSGRAALGRRLQELGYTLSAGQVTQVAELLESATREEWRDPATVLARAVAQLGAERESSAHA